MDEDYVEALVASKFVGIVPTAGLGSRLNPYAYPKELLPIISRNDRDDPGYLRPVMQFSLDLLRAAGVLHSYVVISSWKYEIIRIFGDGTQAGLLLSYIVREKPRGLADAVDATSTWVAKRNVCLVLPDVIIQPANVLRQVCLEQLSSRADIVLGVFHTSTPEQLGPVSVLENGDVDAVFDKPQSSQLTNTWGVAVWSPAFTTYLSDLLRQTTAELPLGHAFHRAIEDGFKVRAVSFPQGTFIDVGTPAAIAAMLEAGLVLNSLG